MQSRIRQFLLILTILIFSLVLDLMSATGSLTGRITGKKTAEPLPGTNIQILGTFLGASSNLNGSFRADNIPMGVYSVRVSMIGYRTITKDTVRIQSNKVTTIDFKLVETPIELDPIVVLAGKTRQRLDQSPVSISVITAREIKERNPQNLIEALETAPGVHFIGNQINIRGSTGYTFGAGNKVLLLLDGVPVYASDTGEFNWDMLPPLDVEHIEVLKGAGSTLWGSSALGGVVNVITKSPTEEGRLLFSASAGKYDKPYYEEWDWTNPNRLYNARQDVSYSKRFNRFGLRISTGHYFSTGYTELGRLEKWNLTGKFDYRFSKGIKWTGYAAYSYIDRGYFVQWKGQNDPYEVDETNLDNYAVTNQLNVYSKLDVPFSARFAMSFRVSVVRTLMGNQFGEASNFNPAFGQGCELQSFWIPLPDHALTIGIQYQQDAGSTQYFGDHKGFFIGPYIQYEWKDRDNYRLSIGLRYDRYQLIDKSGEDLFSPRIGLNWQPWEKTHFRASVGSGFRAATIVERFLELSIMNFHIVKNEDLKAESSWAFDFGFRHYITDDWNIDVSLFNNDYWNLIEAHLNLIRGQIQFRNIPRARIQGIEATTNMTWNVNFLGTVMVPGLRASMTAMNHKELEWNDPLPYRPKVLANVKAFVTIGSARIEADYRFASKIDEVKVYPINDRVPMKFVDVRFSYDIWKLKLQVGVNNLLQYNYAPMESNMMPMRTFTFAIQGKL